MRRKIGIESLLLQYSRHEGKTSGGARGLLENGAAFDSEGKNTGGRLTQPATSREKENYRGKQRAHGKNAVFSALSRNGE